IGPMRPEIFGSSVGLVPTQRGQEGTSTIFGCIARANGRGWAGRTSSTKRGRTGLRGRLPQAMFLERDTTQVLGPTWQEISGSSVGKVTTQRGQSDRSTIYGSIARANGRGWAGRTSPTRRRRTGLKGRLPQAMFLERDTTQVLGPTWQEISGSSVGKVTTQ